MSFVQNAVELELGKIGNETRRCDIQLLSSTNKQPIKPRFTYICYVPICNVCIHDTHTYIHMLQHTYLRLFICQ